MLEMEKFMQIHFQFWKAMRVEGIDEIIRLRRCVDLHRQHLWTLKPTARCPLIEDDPFAIFQIFADKLASSQRFSKHIYNMISKSLIHGGHCRQRFCASAP